MRTVKLALLVVVFCLVSFAQMTGGQYFLVDQRTQMPVLSVVVQPNWLVTGKATWSNNPACPVSWYFWTMRPDQKVKMIVSSLAVIPASGQLRQVAILQNPSILANQYMQNVQNDHNIGNIRIADAHFIQKQPDQNLINSRIRMARENGIQPTNFYYTELYIRYDGIRNNENYSAVMYLPMLATENRASAFSFASVVELLCPMSFSCPSNQVDDTMKQTEALVKTMQANPHFIDLTNRIAKQRTANWLRIQNEIRNQQLEAASSTSQTLDRVRDKWSEYIRDVDTVSNPNTGEKMFVDNRYDHAWINNNNEVIYHNTGFNTPNASTSSFDPNSNALFNNTNWRKLK